MRLTPLQLLPRSLPLSVLLLALLAACGGGGAGNSSFEETFPVPDGGGGGGSGGTGTTPPPTTPQTPLWNPTAAAYGRSALYGAFPSDLVRHGDTLFAVDADAVETGGARILAFDASGSSPVPSTTFATTVIRDTHLIDDHGRSGDATNPIGFGFFINDILISDATLAFALVNAGGSDSLPTLSNVVVFNPTTGVVRQTLNLATPYVAAGTLSDSTGGIIPGGTFIQSGAEGMALVPAPDGSARLYVAMSNLVFAAPSYGATKYPGTLQVVRVDPARTQPLSHIQQGLRPTTVIRTRDYNPVAIAAVHYDPGGGQFPITRLLVTVAGTTGYDAQFNLVPVTPASVEAYDGLSGAFEGAFRLGLTGLSAVRPALGQDAAGHRVGFYPSSVTGEVYLLRLDGLYGTTVNPGQLSILRGPLNGIPITAPSAGGPGGNITGVGLSPDGRTLAVSGFGDLFATPQQPGRLFLLNLPTDLLNGAGFGVDFTPGSTAFGTSLGHTLGNLVLMPNDGDRPDIFVNLSGPLDASFLGSGGASLGSLQTFGLIK